MRWTCSSDPWFVDLVAVLHSRSLEVLTGEAHEAALRELVVQSSSLFVKLSYAGPLPRRAGGRVLALGACAAFPLGPDDAGDPRQ